MGVWHCEVSDGVVWVRGMGAWCGAVAVRDQVVCGRLSLLHRALILALLHCTSCELHCVR